MRVIFNVGGTRFETNASTIKNNRREPLDLLNMLLDHHTIDEIFIDRDPSNFQKILNIYRGSGELETDEIELDFYGLSEPKRELSKRERIEERLIDHRKKLLKKRKENIESKYDEYASFLEVLLESSELCFLYAETKPDNFSKMASTWKGVHYPESYFSKLRHDYEFKKYVNSLGYEVTITNINSSKLTKYEHQPASTYNGTYTSRAKTEIHIKLSYLI